MSVCGVIGFIGVWGDLKISILVFGCERLVLFFIIGGVFISYWGD